VACLYSADRVAIHDLDSSEQKQMEVRWPLKCAASPYYSSVTSFVSGLCLFTIDGNLLHIVPDSKQAFCCAVHPSNPCLLGIGFQSGSVRLWDVGQQAFVSKFKEHTGRITKIRFAHSGRLLVVSSSDRTASIVTLDDQFKLLSCIKLEGHSRCVSDIITLHSPLNQCVTCSDDRTIKVWDLGTGVCLRTLSEHTDLVTSLELHPSRQLFASGSHDKSIVIWSGETFEVQRRLQFPHWVLALVWGHKYDTLYASVYNCGVISCDPCTGEINSSIISIAGSIIGLALGTMLSSCSRHKTSNLMIRPSPFSDALDSLDTCPVALARTTHCAHGCSGAAEGAQSGTTDAGAIRACGDHSASCAVAR
jgi:WD40 repeat protein